jgi:hypothetical protein
MTPSHCGPHCGTITGAGDTVTRAGHCNCIPLCHAGNAPAAVTEHRGQAAAPRGPDGQPLTGTPMCARWYDGVQVLPWISHLDGCMCAVSAQALPQQHGRRCPVWKYWNRTQAEAATGA